MYYNSSKTLIVTVIVLIYFETTLDSFVVIRYFATKPGRLFYVTKLDYLVTKVGQLCMLLYMTNLILHLLVGMFQMLTKEVGNVRDAM